MPQKQELAFPGDLRGSKDFDAWASGYGVIAHAGETRNRIVRLCGDLVPDGNEERRHWVMEKLAAADRLASAAMWLVVHMTYANRIDFSGEDLAAEDFKKNPEGHTGGSLNMVPAYVGYLLANVLSGRTRSWVMGQGHCVAAIEAVNVLTGNLLPEQKQRYGGAVDGLTRLVRDFYSYELDALGRPAVPLGSHVNACTAGGVMEGGYLGFAETQYVHMPLKGESLVAFLSDGAFEEQRGADWAPRWWRAEDCGLVAPIMILNGRRIEERCEIEQEGGAAWLARHLRVSGFEPIEIDGRDPAAFAWAILEMESRLAAAADRIARGMAQYPVRLPYAMARTVKGYGFPGADTNRSHNLPLPANPHSDAASRASFNQGAARLRVGLDELARAVDALNTHEAQARPPERDHALARRMVPAPAMPEPDWALDGAMSPMDAVDRYFVRLIAANPRLRPRLGNPDELRSNHMGLTLTLLKHRANRPEPGSDEAVAGAVITALNEEAVIGAALGNKGGINLAVSYEAFAPKMLGALRQEIIFARHQKECGRSAGWLGMPLIVSSHVWENGKNEQSHQDPAIGEALLGEMSDVARVLFPVDANTSVEALRSIYGAHGVIGCLVVPKRAVPALLGPGQSALALRQGAITLRDDGQPRLQLVAMGAYQLEQALLAHARLIGRGVSSLVTAILEPGRLREPRDVLEREFVLADDEVDGIFPRGLPRVLALHTRPEPMTGLLRRIDGGPGRWLAHGYRNQGGTLDANGMLFANGCSWAHLVASAARLVGQDRQALLDADECEALDGRGEPRRLFSGARP